MTQIARFTRDGWVGGAGGGGCIHHAFQARLLQGAVCVVARALFVQCMLCIAVHGHANSIHLAGC
jgi:hypothetical protein